MIRILFVCHGNICRSPMAEFIFKDLAHKAGAEEKFFVSSAATSSEEIWGGVGNPVYPPAQRELAKHGISCGGKRAVRLKKDDYKKYDYIIGMDSENMRNMQRLFGGDKQGKVFKLLSFAGSEKMFQTRGIRAIFQEHTPILKRAAQRSLINLKMSKEN